MQSNLERPQSFELYNTKHFQSLILPLMLFVKKYTYIRALFNESSRVRTYFCRNPRISYDILQCVFQRGLIYFTKSGIIYQRKMQTNCDIIGGLILAARQGKLDRVGALINSFGLCYSQKWEGGYVLLCEALKNRHTKVAELLLRNGCQVNSENKNPSYTPLHFAVINADVDIVDTLLHHGANVDAECEDGTTPLYNAVRWKRIKIIKLLLSKGANANGKGKDGITFLHTAAQTGYLQIVQLLLKYGAYVNSVCTYFGNKCCTPLYIAIIHRRENVVKLLLECGANVDAQDQDGKTILHFAVESGRSLIVEHVLKHCPDRNNESNESIVNIAVHSNGNEYSKIVENLLAYGFTINLENTNNCKLLHAAVEKGCLTIVEELLQYGTDVNMLDNSISGNGCTPLHVATRNKQEAVAKLLIGHGADVNAKDAAERTPIFYAVEKNCKEIVEVLLQHGADVNTSDKYGRIPLHFTALNEHVTSGCNLDINVNGEIAKLLLRRGANVDTEIVNNMLHIACEKGYEKLVETLLEYNAAVNCTDKNSRTPLHIASEIGILNIVEVLLKFGASVDSKDPNGRTALHIACDKRHGKIAIALLDHGCDIIIINSCYDKVFRSYDSDIYSRAYGRGYSPWDDIAKILKRHMVKVKTANLYAIKDLPSISSDYETNHFQNKCEKEVARMKSEKVGNASISFYDILSKGISQLAICAGNANIVQVFGSDDYKRKFPIYATMINSKFRKGEKRKELMQQGNEIFYYFFTNFLGIPRDCTERIFNYLRDEDLRTIMYACKPISLSSPNSDNNVVISA